MEETTELKMITYELPIGYKQCADSMLKMYVDGILTDSEYNHIMNKLTMHYKDKA